MTNVLIIGNFNPDVCPSGIIIEIVVVSATLDPVTASATKYTHSARTNALN
jgi:hypothetical protein